VTHRQDLISSVSDIHGKVEFLEPGSVVGDYTVGEVIGVGGFAVVYAAHDGRLDRGVALKIVRPEIVRQNPATAKRFLREIKLVKSLEHPNVIRLYDFGETADGLPFMTTELVKGETLTSILQTQGKMSVVRARHIILQILSALVEAHNQNIIHRDIKPSNIMLTSKGADADWVQVLDFGIGKTLIDAVGEVSEDDISEEDDGSAGTPRYMAPELFAGEEIGPFTDIYSLGLIFFEMLTGEQAVEGASVYEIVANIFKNPLRLTGAQADSDLALIVERAAAIRASDRFQTALEFYQCLDHDYDESGALITMMDAMALARFEQTADGIVVVPRVPMPSGHLLGGHREAFPTVSGGASRTIMLVAAVLALFVVVVGLFAVVFVGSRTPSPELLAAVDVATDRVERALVEAEPEPEPEPPPEPVVVEVPPKKTVKISIQTKRKGVKVTLADGTVLCETTPCEIEFEESDDPVEIFFIRKGYESKPLMVTRSRNNAIKVGLKREATKNGKGKTSKFDPFDVRHH